MAQAQRQVRNVSADIDDRGIFSSNKHKRRHNIVKLLCLEDLRSGAQFGSNALYFHGADLRKSSRFAAK